MFNPEPMPVDVMSALGVLAALGALLVAVDALLVGEMVELMSFYCSALVAQFIGSQRPNLSKLRTKSGRAGLFRHVGR
jgi:hypothetical protein